MTSILVKKGGDPQTQRTWTHRKSHVKTEAEPGVMLTQVKEHQALPKAGRGK